MAKKSFLEQTLKPHSTIMGSVQAVQEVQVTQEVQEVPTVQEVQEVQATQGRKGMKQQRINMAFTPANIDYIRTMAALSGKTMTQYVNALIDADRAKNKALYDSAAEIKKNL